MRIIISHADGYRIDQPGLKQTEVNRLITQYGEAAGKPVRIEVYQETGRELPSVLLAGVTCR